MWLGGDFIKQVLVITVGEYSGEIENFGGKPGVVVYAFSPSMWGSEVRDPSLRPAWAI